ncbi:MAG TPA: superinfection immunity protein [Gemmatimonas aurantiaca]|uniref:Superinfection immunity protein n=2 Tax=Gemmatimonas aurantiaca TaxID=173480 RepID=A0A3D4V435_9BACT|nr:superinfection immunity protein [Gemmatimonas aurantiaca]BAH37464.1 hypothetical membrane protein [Gemmatimonas aurantiaca T-27]HCT55880.1 superinfection immunity protein [Gemmatimonas aurantiaca]
MILLRVTQSLDSASRTAASAVEAPAPYSGGGLPKGGIMIVISVALYILPTLLAWKSGHPRFRKIALVNLLLGWTVIGWIAAMVMLYIYTPPPDGEVDVPHIPGQ